MTHYDHATAMAYKLDQWADERVPRNYEKEILEAREREIGTSKVVLEKPSLFRRCLRFLRPGKDV